MITTSLLVLGLMQPQPYPASAPATVSAARKPGPTIVFREVDIVADVAPALDAIDIDVTEHVRFAEDTFEIPIVLAAERYRRIPESLRPSDLRETFVNGFAPGGFDNVRIFVDDQTCRPATTSLAAGEVFASCRHRVDAHRTVRVRILARLIVPERYGSFGRVHRELTLGGGWAPFVGWPADGPRSAPHRVRVRIPENMISVIGRTLVSSSDGRRWIEANAGVVAQVPLILRPPTARAVSMASGRARYLVTRGFLAQLGKTDLHRREVEAAVTATLDFLDDEGLWDVSQRRPLVIVEAPLRRYLAEACDGLVLVSDRAFRMLDIDRFLVFHRFWIMREMMSQIVRARTRSAEPTALEIVSSDALGAWLADRYIKAQFGRAEDAFDVLNVVSFIPSIDSMLYAPDLPFVSAYFRFIKEDDPLHANLRSPASPFPRGKILYEKLLDAVGPKATDSALGRVLAGASLRRAVRERFPEKIDADRFLDTWLRDYPDVQYALSGWTSVPEPNRCDRCSSVTIDIRRDGAIVAEPVGILLRDANGNVRDLQAPATTAALRTITASLSAPIDLIEIDPHARLAEASTHDNPSPRFDNRSSPAWKVLLNNFNIQLAATEGAVDTAIDVGFQRRHDVHWAFALRADYAQDTIALSGRATRYFGPPVSQARLAHSFGLGLTGEYLRPGFASAPHDGFSGTLSLAYGYDNRESIWAPEAGTAVRVGASIEHAFVEQSSLDKDGDADAVAVSLRALRQWQVNLRHQITVRASFSTVLVGQPRRQLLYSLGGRAGIRGYGLDDALGRTRALVSGEWLHPLLSKFESNGFFLAWTTGLDGAFFADAGLIGDDVIEAVRGPVFADVGYGLRFYIDYLGVRPGVMAIDFAFPLVKTRGETELGPVAIYVAFGQSFVAF